MCGDWLRLDDEIARIMKGLATDTGRTASVAAAAAGERGRAHHDAKGGRSAVILEFGKRPGTLGDPGKVDWRQTVTIGVNVTPGTAGLGNARLSAKL